MAAGLDGQNKLAGEGQIGWPGDVFENVGTMAEAADSAPRGVYGKRRGRPIERTDGPCA